MNERDSEQVAAQLVARGYTLTASEADADVILLNTCSVRDMAEQKALGKMGLLASDVRKQGRDVVLGFLGCMAQRRGAELLDRVPDVDLIVGTQKFHRVADYLDEIIQKGGTDIPACDQTKIIDVDEEKGSESTIRDHLPSFALRPPPSAFVSIMQGCDMHCTFCIVPTTRGSERSRSIADIVAEARMLVAHGVKEITLLGQIVTSYGRKDLENRDGKKPFVQLLEALDAIEGLERIRFTSPHPLGFSDDLIACYGRLRTLCEFVHLPVQSGSNRILKAMNRPYTVEKYLRIIEKLRARVPDIALCTDIIVGFPGETDEDFAATRRLVEQIQFDEAYVFRYSPRSGTPAAAMADDVPQSVKESRNQELLSLLAEISVRKHAEQVGQTVDVLVEGPSEKNPARYFGRTRRNYACVFVGSSRHAGQLLSLRITRATQATLYGDPVLLGMDDELANEIRGNQEPTHAILS